MFLLRIISTMIAILIIVYVFPSIIRIDGLMAPKGVAVVFDQGTFTSVTWGGEGGYVMTAAFILGIVNAVILTFPITLISLGFFLLIINGLMLCLTTFFVPGFYINGIMGAVLGSVLISIVNLVLLATVGKK